MPWLGLALSMAFAVVADPKLAVNRWSGCAEDSGGLGGRRRLRRLRRLRGVEECCFCFCIAGTCWGTSQYSVHTRPLEALDDSMY